MADAQGPDEEQREIVPGLLLSVSRALTLQLLQEPPSSRTKVVVGYAGWSPGQLENEIAASSWLTTSVDPALIFGVPPDQMWEEAIRRLGSRPGEPADKFRSALGDGSETFNPVFTCARGCSCCLWSSRLQKRDATTSRANDDSNTPIPETQKLQTMAARFAPVELTADVAALPENERQALGEAGGSGQSVRCAVSASGLGRQRGDAPRPRPGRLAPRARPPTLLPDQQGPVVAAR